MTKKQILIKKINVRRLAEQSAELAGEVTVDDLPAIGGCTNCDPVKVNLKIYQQDGRDVVSGHVVAKLQLICQRCLQPMDYIADRDFLVSPAVPSEEIGQLPKQYEPVFLNSGMLDVYQLIDEELILSLPAVAMHDDLNCQKDYPIDRGG